MLPLREYRLVAFWISSLASRAMLIKHTCVELLTASTDNEFSRAQNTLLNGQYLDPTKFENLTANECKLRYNTPLVESGTGFGVPIPSDLKMYGLGPTNSFQNSKNSSGGDRNINQVGGDIEYACTFCQQEIQLICVDSNTNVKQIA